MLDRLIAYGPYVWGAYALFGLALVVELLFLRAHRRSVLRRIDEARLLALLAAREGRASVRSGDEA